jgi:hypothetical protein
MADDDKSKDLFKQEKLVLEANSGFVLPVRYQGAWVKVRAGDAFEFLTKKLPYEAKIEITRAVQNGHVFETDRKPSPDPSPKLKSGAVARAEAAKPKAKTGPQAAASKGV